MAASVLVIDDGDTVVEVTGGNTGAQGPTGPAGGGGGGGGSPSARTVVWEPGATSSDYTLGTWGEVATLLGTDPFVTLGLKPSVGNPCLVTSSVQCSQRTKFVNAIPGSDSVAILQFSSGAQLLNPAGFSAVGIEKGAGGGAVIKNTLGGRIVFDDACSIYTTALIDEAIIDVANAGVQLLFLRGSNVFSYNGAPTKGLIKIDQTLGGAFLVLIFQNGIGNVNFPFMVEGGAADFLLAYSDISWTFPEQSFFTGTVYNYETQQPRSGTTAQRPAVPALWMQYGDTTLGKPIWWNGVAWIDSAGTVV